MACIVKVIMEFTVSDSAPMWSLGLYRVTIRRLERVREQIRPRS